MLLIRITTYITLIVAITLSGVAAYFSVLGLMKIFSASPEAVMIMAIVLELAKITTAYWAHINWNVLPRIIKAYLVCAVLILMGITSLGIYGFLAEAHISQKSEIVAQYDTRINSVDAKINNQQQLITDIDKQLDALDKAIEETATASQQGFLTKSYQINEQYLEQKQKLTDKKEPIQEKILTLTQEKINIQRDKALSETKVGPLKYVANLIYGEATPDELNTAVRWLIIILIVVFDPLAILLLIATGYIMKRLERPIDRSPVKIDLSKAKTVKKPVKVFRDTFEEVPKQDEAIWKNPSNRKIVVKRKK